MKTTRLTAALLAAAALAACASPQSRIKKNRAEFDSYSPAVQKKIQDGQVDIGFTKKQAAIALGRPDRISTRKTATAVQEIWAYGRTGGSHLGFSLGMGMGGPIGIGTGIGVGPEGDAQDRLRVVFQDDAVISVENVRP